MGKRVVNIIVIGLTILTVAGCGNQAETASRNLSVAADQFEVERRIVFFNGITDTYLMTIEGRCSIKSDSADGQLEVTCKVGREKYKKHFLGLSDNVSYFVEQVREIKVDEFHYKVVFKPETILPDVDVVTSGGKKGDSGD